MEDKKCVEPNNSQTYLQDEVYQTLRQRLINCQWQPRQIVQEKVLASELGISKTPVREALQILAIQGWVKPVSRVGYVVQAIAMTDLLENFQFRVLIETELTTRMAGLPQVSVPNRGLSECEYHHVLFRPLGKRRMLGTLADLIDETTRSTCLLGMPHELMDVLASDHDAITDAIQEQESELARSLMAVHLMKLRDSLLAKLRQQVHEHDRLT